jgi:hypothetical protein
MGYCAFKLGLTVLKTSMLRNVASVSFSMSWTHVLLQVYCYHYVRNVSRGHCRSQFWPRRLIMWLYIFGQWHVCFIKIISVVVGKMRPRFDHPWPPSRAEECSAVATYSFLHQTITRAVAGSSGHSIARNIWYSRPSLFMFENPANGKTAMREVQTLREKWV